jgi:gamma-glutamylcyclotransferase (GGCT)/AIG2-like uncharacterized protein YtfP
VTLHFAYGSNMSRALMGARCPAAYPLGLATLAGWRFVINSEGFGSIAPRPGGRVHGVVWRLSARDLAAINAYESVDTGLYLRRRLSVRVGQGQTTAQTMALVYITRRQGQGRPRPGYIDLVVAAAREWELPEPYIRSLARWSPSRWHATLASEASGQRGNFYKVRAHSASEDARKRAGDTRPEPGSSARGARAKDTGELG